MQLLEGATMSSYIESAAQAPKEARAMRGEYSLKERIGTLLGVCEAIHFAHERGVIHRDLKPDNVMLGRFREVYVMDWGLARIVGSPIDLAAERGRETDVGPPAPTAVEDPELLEHSAPVLAPQAESEPALSSTATRQGEVMGTRWA